eukprot:NODE_664_length_757_cov_262.495763_g599_i0.p1 GENE.NODE_664_length_757_cov_262.495763_g599_i0~~NODE_664_length_757_cov_262.495763_g599_i0.p1  ORF type:complete len:205 (+),score=41.45 NODE_664_length_757_cov_262.495763_g599_i0:36-650(+)
MKMLLVLVAVLVACVAGQGKPVCLPPVFQIDAQRWDTSRQLYIREKQYIDHTKQHFRVKESLHPDHQQDDTWYVRDILAFPLNQTAYIIEVEDTPEHNMTKCTRVQISGEPFRDPCFSQNGTHTHTDVIGGSLLVHNYYTEDHHHQSMPVYQHIALVDMHATGGIIGIPVQRSYWSHNDHGEEFFENYNSTLPVGIWTIPGICL